MLEGKLKIIFINYGAYSGCCGVHIHFLAKVLVELGHECVVCLPHTDGAHEYFGKVNYPIYTFRQLSELPIELWQGGILHVWTTRETSRAPTNLLRQRINLPFLVHLEDHELLITAKMLGLDPLSSLEEIKRFAKQNPQALEHFYFTNPLHFEPIMRMSSGVTCIMKSLEEFVPAGVARMTFWPACEEEFFRIPLQRNEATRQSCGFEEDTFVLVYPGAIHEFNADSFCQLLLAVHSLHKEGFKIQIIRCGIENNNYSEAMLELYRKYVVFMGEMPAWQLPHLVELADILVQPGGPGAFDDYRFPSKVPYFLASGRPVILPNCNVAEKLQHGHDCFLMQTGRSEEIVKYLKILMTHKQLALTMGAQGRATSRNLFSWEKAAQSLIPFYRQALAKHSV